MTTNTKKITTTSTATDATDDVTRCREAHAAAVAAEKETQSRRAVVEAAQARARAKEVPLLERFPIDDEVKELAIASVEHEDAVRLALHAWGLARLRAAAERGDANARNLMTLAEDLTALAGTAVASGNSAVVSAAADARIASYEGAFRLYSAECQSVGEPAVPQLGGGLIFRAALAVLGAAAVGVDLPAHAVLAAAHGRLVPVEPVGMTGGEALERLCSPRAPAPRSEKLAQLRRERDAYRRDAYALHERRQAEAAEAAKDVRARAGARDRQARAEALRAEERQAEHAKGGLDARKRDLAIAKFVADARAKRVTLGSSERGG